MKKIFSEILFVSVTAAILFGLFIFSASALTSGDFEYSVSSESATITGYTGSGGHVNIPSSIDGYSVTSIGLSAFKNKTNITSFSLPSSVTTLKGRAFEGCTGLTKITIPSSVTSIGDDTFKDCTNVSEIDYNLKTYTVYSSSSFCFENIGSKTTGVTVKVGSNVTKIPEGMFAYQNIKEVIFYGRDIDIIGRSAFRGCTALTSLRYYGDAKELGHLNIPSSVTTLVGWAFEGCTGLTKITIPSSVTSIDDDIFKDCTNVSEIDYNLKTYTVYSSSSYCFENTGSKTNGVTVKVGANVTKIPEGMFADQNIKKVIIMNPNISYIGGSAFANCGSTLSTAIFCGTAAQWGLVSKGNYNEPLTSVIRFHTSCSVSSYQVIKEATCTSSGTQKNYCSICERYSTATISSLGHSCSLWSVTTESTCTETGINSGNCIRCGTLMTKTIPAKGHSYSEWTVITSPDCTIDGMERKICGNCGDIKENILEAYGHSFGSWYVENEAECTIEGNLRRDCSNCEEYETKPINKLGHSYSNKVVAPTCTDEGYTTHTCSRCGDTYKDTIVAKKGHELGAAASCTNDQICTVCKIIIEPKLGHNYSQKIFEPTCTEDGYTLHTCLRCQHEYVDSFVDKKGHSYRSIHFLPTCTEEGYESHTCLICSYEYIDKVTPSLGHKPGIEAGCLNDQICLVCEAILENKLGHDYLHKVFEPTCTEDGYTVHSCSRCEYEYKDSIVGKTGHSYSHEVVKPTYDEQGYTIHRCSICEDTYKDAFVPKLEIVFGDANGDGEIDTKDAVLLAQFLAKWAVEIDPISADCNGDGVLDTKDAVLLAQYLAKWDVTLGK